MNLESKDSQVGKSFKRFLANSTHAEYSLWKMEWLVHIILIAYLQASDRICAISRLSVLIVFKGLFFTA